VSGKHEIERLTLSLLSDARHPFSSLLISIRAVLDLNE